MCGIYFSGNKSKFLGPSASLHHLLCARGPDSRHALTFFAPRGVDDSETLSYVTVFSTVLSLRGEQVVSQPLQNEDAGLVFCWNGEAWKIGQNPFSGNDAQVIFDLLVTALTQPATSFPDSRQATISNILFSVVGPFSFVLYDKFTNRVYYGRDRFGRRSLLQSYEPNGLALCSVAAPGKEPEWLEVEPNGLYAVNLCEQGRPDENKLKPELVPWSTSDFATRFLQHDPGESPGFTV